MVSIRIAQLSVVSVAAIAAMAALTAPASAAQAPSMRAAYAVTPSIAAKPNSKIIGSGKKVNYSPTSLKVKWSGPVQKKCTAAKASFTVTNKAKATETVKMSAKIFAKVPAGKVLYVCAWGTGTGTGKFGLAANPKAKLTVHVSKGRLAATA